MVGTNVGLSGWAAGESERRGAFVCAVGFVLAALAVTPYANEPLGASFPLFGMLLAASVMGTAITALLLLLQARALGSMPTAVLGTGFAYAGTSMVVYALIYPGMFGTLPKMVGANIGGNGLLWVAWHAGLLIAILAFNRLRRFDATDPQVRRTGQRMLLAFGVAYAVVTPAALWLPGIPPPYEHGHWTPIYTLVESPLIVALALAVIVGAIRRRHSSVLDLWLAVVALAIILDTYLTVTGTTRFTLGWWASRMEMLLATTAILGVLLSQAARMYASLVERAEILEGEAHTDMLTGMPNRRRFDEEYARSFGSALRRASALAVAVVDIDRFKNYNDAFGHQAGDEALQHIAHAIAESVERSGDFAARYGGEEFVVILEDTLLDGALSVAERIRCAVLDERIPAPNGGILSVSAGIAAREPGESAAELLGRADAALYDAKNAGRNRVAAWQPPLSLPLVGGESR
jgi:diguanylate cyclase (GGDEF)-like protein